MGEILINRQIWNNTQAKDMSPHGTKAPAIDAMMKGMQSPAWTKRQAYDLPQYGMTGPANGTILKEIQSPIPEGTQDSQDSCASPNGKSPSSPSKLEKARDKLEQLKVKQVDLMREKNKWQEGLKQMKAIFDKMKHSRSCLDETCQDIMKNNNLSDQLDNDDFPVLSAGHAGDQTGNQLSQSEHSSRNHVQGGTQRSFDDNNNMKHEVHHNLRRGQTYPRKDSRDDCWDNTENYVKDSQCYTISPDGRCDDHDLSDVSDDSSKSPPSDDSEHIVNGSFSTTHNTQHNEHNPTRYTQGNDNSLTHYKQYSEHSPTHYTQHNENYQTTEHDVTNNNSKEKDDYMWVVEKLPPRSEISYVKIFDFLQNADNSCQTPKLTESPTNINTKLACKRPSSSPETPRPSRRLRFMVEKQACLIKPPVAIIEGVASVLTSGKASVIESENSTEVNQAREKSPVRELANEGLLTDNNTDGEQLAKNTKGEETSGKTGSNTGDKAQTEEDRSAKVCQPNDGNSETDSEDLNKTTVGAVEGDSSNKIEPAVTNMQQAEEHNTEVAIKYVDSSIILGKDETNVESKGETDSVNTKYETMTDNRKEEGLSTENIATDGDLKSSKFLKEVLKTSECTRVNDSTKRDEEKAAQHADAGTLLGDKSQVEVSIVDENDEEGQARNDKTKLSTVPENTHEQVESDMCSLKEDDLDKNSSNNCDSSNTCDSSNRTCSATKEFPQVVKDKQVNSVLVDDDNELNCTFILERKTIPSSTPQSRSMTDLSTTDCYEARGVTIVESAKAVTTAAISFVEQYHPNKLNDAKGDDHNTESAGCEDAKSDDSIRKRASGIDNNTEEHLKTKDNTKENDAASDNCEDETGITVETLVNKAGINTANTSQQNKATVHEDGTRFQTMLYNTDWQGILFFIVISLATLLCVFLAIALSYLNA